MSQFLINVHDESKCSGQHCCVHNPSDHHMRTWPLHWRQDTGVMERICPHGVGHPDPDDAAHNIRIGNTHKTIHGCDGCCQKTFMIKEHPEVITYNPHDFTRRIYFQNSTGTWYYLDAHTTDSPHVFRCASGALISFLTHPYYEVT